MARLPVVGGDEDGWGAILNDYLSQSLGTTGLLKTSAAALSVVNVMDPTYGALGNGTTDDTVAIQAAITAAAGRYVYFPTGTYVVTSTLTYLTASATDTAGLKIIGDGMYKTIFDNRVASGPMIRFNNSVSSIFQRGAVLQDFSIITTTSPANSDGIEFKAAWGIRVDNVRVHGLTGNGIVGISTGDADSVAFFQIDRCVLSDNDKWGIDFQDSALTIVLGETTRCILRDNTTGGMRCAGQHLRFQENTFSDNGIGLHIKDGGGGSPRNAEIWDNEFQSNVTSNLQIDAGVCIAGGANHHNCDNLNAAATFRPPVAVDIGSGAFTVAHSHFSRDVVRVTNRGANPCTIYRVGANGEQTFIERPRFTALDGATKWSDAGLRSTFIDDSQMIRGQIAATTTSIAATPSTYQPDTLVAVYHRVVANAGAEAITIDAPTGGVGGRQLILDLFRNTSAELVWTFDASIRTVGFVGPINGQRTSALFTFEPNSAAWVQQGAWSRADNPSAAQVIDAAGDTILANARTVQLSNTTAGSITLTSAPTIANGDSGQRVTIINTGTQDVVIQDQGTLPASNLRLTAATLTLSTRDNVTLEYNVLVGDWVQISSLVNVT